MVAVTGPPLPSAPPARRRGRALGAVALVWAAVLIAGGIWYSLHGRSTIREQTTVEQARPTVDRAITTVLDAARRGPVSVVAISGFDRVGSCRVTPLRAGARYARTVWFFTPNAAEPTLLAAIVDGLPAGYQADRTVINGAVTEFSADAGFYVALTGEQTGPGLIRVTAATGCRPLGRTPPVDPSSAPDASIRAPIESIMIHLGTGVAQWRTHTLPCGLRTVEAVSPAGAAPASLATALTGTGPSLVATDGAYARPEGLAARVAAGDTVVVTETTGVCR